MRVIFVPEGGRFGYGFEYYCSHCDEYVGGSGDEQLSHPSHTTISHLFRATEKIPIDCPNAGRKAHIPVHEIEAKEINEQLKEPK